jgi:hypothetical protein
MLWKLKNNMKKYIIYNSTGEILKILTCTEETFLSIKDHMESMGEFAIEGTADDVTECIDVINKKVVSKPKHILDKQKKDKKDKEDKEVKDLLISQRMDKILRDMAIAQLKAEGHDVK